MPQMIWWYFRYSLTPDSHAAGLTPSADPPTPLPSVSGDKH